MGILFLAIILSILLMVGLAFIGKKIARVGLPKPSSKPISKEELIRKLLSINSPKSPFEIKRKGDILTASWKLVDAKWFEFFKKINLRENYILTILLKEETKTVNAIEKMTSLRSNLGANSEDLSLAYGRSGNVFRGWMPFSIKKEVLYGLKDLIPPDFGKVYKIDFNARAFRRPFIEEIVKSGWKINPCIASLKYGI